MASVHGNIIETPALGRPFQLGMLYDCRNDSTVPGMMLWDREEVVHNKDVDSQHNTEFTVATSDTIEEKANQLKVDGELKLSLLGGNVNLSGAARYFNDTKKSFIQQRLTLHYRTTTRFEQLTMNHLALGQIGHHEVFDHDVATHVVIAVLYGADAYFLFDKELNLSEETTNEQGGVKIAAEKLKILCSAGAQGELNMNEKEKAEMKQLNCTFYGDFKLPSNPTTFEDAVKVYNDLPKMLGENGEHAVPVRVWLYPLVKLDPRAAKFQRNISTDVIRAVESVIESLNVTSMKCGDLMEDTVAKTFNTFHDRVQDFQKLCVEYKQDFMKKLGSILPEIRGGKADIKDLSELLEAHKKSPFNSRDLQQWITVKEKVFNQIKALLKQLQELGAEVVADRDKHLLDLKIENLVSYTFTCLQHSEPLLTKQEIYLNPSTIDNPSENTLGLNFAEKPWTSDKLMSMRNNLKLFKDLITLNKSHENTKFIVESVPQTPDKPCSCILMYENGCSEATCFVPPSKPTCPIIECVTDNSITVQLSSSCADTLKRQLLYKMKQENDWKSQTVTEDRVTLTNLKEGTDYEIKCAAVGKMDYTVESDVTVITTQSVLKSQTELKATESESMQQVIEKVNEITHPDSFATGVQTGNLDQPENHKDESQMDQSLSNNAAKKEIQPSENAGEQSETVDNSQEQAFKTKTSLCFTHGNYVVSGNKYFILQCGVTLNSHVSFIDLLEQKIRSLQKVNTVDECDFILAFCPVVSRAGTDIEGAETKLHAVSATKPAVLVILHHTFDPECVVPNSCRVVNRENTITVDCLFYEDQGLLQCRKNSDAIDHIHMQIKPKIQRTPLGTEGQSAIVGSLAQLFGRQKPHNELLDVVDEACKENAGKLEDFKKEIAEMKLFGLPKNNEVIIGTELRLVLLGRDESDKTAAKNIILGGEEINQSTATATQQRESTQVISGMKVIVVDTPDLLFSGNSLEKVSQTVEPKAFVLVIPVKYLEDKVLSENETQMTLMKLEEIFGTGCWRNTMIIFTVSDELQKKKIEKFIRSGDQEVRRLLEKCENRFHCLSIKESGNGSQVLELLEKIEKMVEGNRNGSPIYQNIRNMEMERHAKDAWIRKMQIQIQKALEKCEQFDEDYEKNLKTLGTGERSAPQRKMFNHMRNQNKLKKVIAEQMKMIYDRVAELEENGQFIKVQQTIWLSLPDEETKTIEKYTKLRQLEEKFLKIMGNAYFY